MPLWGRVPPPELLTPPAQDIWGPLAIVDYGNEAIAYLPTRTDQRLPIGANLAFVRANLARLPGLLVTDFGRAAARADLIVLGKAMPGIKLPTGKQVLNLYRL